MIALRDVVAIQAIYLRGSDIGAIKLFRFLRHGGGVVVVQPKKILPGAHLPELRVFPCGHVQPGAVNFLLLGQQFFVEQCTLADGSAGLGDNLRDGVLAGGGRLGGGFAVDCVDYEDHLLSEHEKSTPRTRRRVLVCFLASFVKQLYEWERFR